uniref:Uncharacterized protein n=1 Tax=Lepeophtheirus salmonis TaxID=72036 RepID=A0A0K2TH18_LEPSM
MDFLAKESESLN